jgi:CRP/FNR family transcriptional regulator, cyclic AMP receptor protein
MLKWLLRPTVPKLPLFRALNRTERQTLAEITDHIELTAGQTMIQEGEPTPSLWIIESGRVAVSKNTEHAEENLTTLGEGAVLGELSLLDGQPASATVKATQPSGALKIERQRLMDLRDNHPPTYYKIIREVVRIMVERVRAMNARIRALRSDPARTADLVQAHKRRGEVASAGTGLMSLGTTPSGNSSPSRPKRRRSRATGPLRITVPRYNVVSGAAGIPARAEWLERVPRFALMGRNMRLGLGGYLMENEYVVNQTVCEEGEPGDCAFIVAAGTVEVQKKLSTGEMRAIHTFGPGDMFGEMSLIDGGNRAATCVASSDAMLFSLPARVFERLLDESSPLAFRFLEIVALDLSHRLRRGDDQFADIYSEADAEGIEARLDRVEARLHAAGNVEDSDLAEAFMNLKLD